MKLSDKYDVTIVGAGAGGIACAYTCAKFGLKTLLIEKNIHAGGLITSGLVIPVMKLDDGGLNNNFYKTLISFAKLNDCSITYSDGNEGWFNIEKLKSVFDKLLTSVNCNILYHSSVDKVVHNENSFTITVNQEILSVDIETNYLVDATGNGKIFRGLNLEILKDEKINQASSMRFLMSNVDIKIFSEWLKTIDSDESVTTICNIDGEIHCSTAYTWDKNRKWALESVFNRAVLDGVLELSDTVYFQLFTMPKMPGTVAFNCPRLIDENENTNHNSLFQTTKLIIQGRERILRFEKFCKKYLKGFENAYISNIADMLGIRESIRVRGKKVFSVSDIINGVIPENPALASNYPIDIHSQEKNKDKLQFTKHRWYMPIECLISDTFDNLFVVGRCISADFYAQAAVRTQANCFSMGEAVGRHIKNLQKYNIETIEVKHN